MYGTVARMRVKPDMIERLREMMQPEEARLADAGFVASYIEALPGHLLVAGRGGIWHTTAPEATPPDWYPLVNHLQVTINPAVAADPKRPGHLYVGSMDWTMISTRRLSVTARGSLGGYIGCSPAYPTADSREAASPLLIRYRTTSDARAVDSSHALG